MTYNFDPERWFSIEEAALAERRRKGELDADAFEAAMQELSPVAQTPVTTASRMMPFASVLQRTPSA